MASEIEKKQAAIINELNKPLTAVDRLRLFATEPDTFSFDADDAEAVVDHIEALEAEVSRYQQLLDAAIDDYNDARNATLEEAAKVAESIDPNTDEIAAAIRALKSDPAPVPDPKPFTFADPVRQAEWERHKAESKRREGK